MQSWPKVYLPPALVGIEHPPLSIRDSYSGEIIHLHDAAISTYVCGITPYDATHLGHAATYLTFDLVHRYLNAAGKTVTFTENITDIDDPLLERALRDSQDWRELATSQIDLFCDDMTELRILPPSNFLGVVESMSTIIEYIERLLGTGKCYQLAGDYYLDISSITGALEGLPCSLAEAIDIFKSRGGDPDRPGKRHPLDTLIWMKERNGEPSWESSLGKGRPGWHIECVAIALSTLTRDLEVSRGSGSCINLQGGGNDLRFPHHYMTSVQVQAITERPFAKVYCHTGLIAWQGEKMSKSLGNLLFVSKMMQDGDSAAEIRFALINRDYAADFEWNAQKLSEARNSLTRIGSCLAREEVAPSRPVVQEIVDAIADNLDVPRAIRSLMNWCEATETGTTGGSAGEISRALDLYLGIAI